MIQSAADAGHADANIQVTPQEAMVEANSGASTPAGRTSRHDSLSGSVVSQATSPHATFAHADAPLATPIRHAPKLPVTPGHLSSRPPSHQSSTNSLYLGKYKDPGVASIAEQIRRYERRLAGQRLPSPASTSCMQRFVIDPRSSAWIGWWDLVISLSLIFIAVCTPFEVGFMCVFGRPTRWQARPYLGNRPTHIPSSHVHMTPLLRSPRG